ncbi:NUDIX domain-containing protein [Solimonas soli]|uniref:NUDIX domain-containing protein n=1 Tax=Solimonas soli TaxID=413479 RepID=UPI00048A3ADF|nr:NUDIX domain-containing protein [Solimonas soli]
MPRKQSAGLLVYRHRDSGPEVFLVHPGGPLWARRDDGAWSIPKGEFGDGEDALLAARREFVEETGQTVDGVFRALAPVRQPGGKRVHAWAVEGEVDAQRIVSNRFTLEWPPRSGQRREFPEVDRAQWFTLDAARVKLLKGQRPLLGELEGWLHDARRS